LIALFYCKVGLLSAPVVPLNVLGLTLFLAPPSSIALSFPCRMHIILGTMWPIKMLHFASSGGLGVHC
jgi:hypothetical protein